MEILNNSSEPQKITLLDTGIDSMTGGRIKRAQKFVLNEPFMLTYGDGVGDINIENFLKFHKSHGKAMTMTSVQPEGRFGALNIGDNNEVQEFKEKPKDNRNWINAGFFVCEAKVFDYIKEGDNTVFEKEPLSNLAKEMQYLVDSSLDFWLTHGEYSKKFEKQLADYLNVRWTLLVNSGSSANLLAFYALTSPLLKEKQIKRGDEVITVAAGFPTTVSPIVQYGAIPVFVDMELTHLNIDVTQLEYALSSKTKAIMIAHSLGNPFNLKAVKEFCDKNNLWLIEDNCDVLGSTYEGKQTGTWGDIGTSNFYPPHHITMGEGGAAYTNNPLLKKIMLSMRDRGRDCWCASGVDNTCRSRFSQSFGSLPVGYDHKYVYSHFGFNLKGIRYASSSRLCID